MISALLSPATALANCLWGWKRYPGPRATSMLIPALVAGLAGNSELYTQSAITAAIVFLGLLIWRAPGTGTSFVLVHRDLSRDPKPDIFGRVAARLVGTESVLRYALLVAFLRGSIPSMPLFLGLAVLTGHWWALGLPVAAGASWVLSYWLSGLPGEKGAVERAEWANGAAMGAMIWMTT